MAFRLPSFPEILAVARSRGADSEAPELWNGLVGWWPFLEGGGDVVHDVSGYGNHGALTNLADNWVVSPSGYALDSGTNGDLISGSLPSITAPYAWSIWFRCEDSTWREMGGLTNSDDSQFSGVYWDGTANQLSYNNKDSVAEKALLVGSVSESVWHYLLCLVYAGSPTDQAVYIDGTLGVFEDTWGRSPVVDRFKFCDAGIKSATEYDGQLKDFRVRDRHPTPSEIAAEYADPWAMGTLRRRVFKAAVAAGVAPTSHLYGPLVGPLGGPV